MSHRKNRIAPKIKNQKHVLPNGPDLSAKVVSPGRSTEVKETLQGDNNGMPFIIVDGINMRSKHNLQVALAKVEKKRMKAIQKDCRSLPLLEYTRPPTCTNPSDEFEKDAMDELDFEDDLRMLCLELPLKDEGPNKSGSVTPIPFSTSTENLHKNTIELEEIRQKLEKIRNSQESENSLSGHDTHLTDETVLEPKLTRQGTFEVQCYDQLVNPKQPLTNSASNRSINVKKAHSSSQKLTGAVTTNSDRNVTQTNSTNNLPKNKSHTDMQRKNNKTCKSQSSTEIPKIISQIGDLLLQLPGQKHDKKKLETTKRPLSYLVTISPTADVSVEAVESESESNQISQMKINENGSQSLERLKFSASSKSLPRNPVITIFAPVSPNTGKNSHFKNPLQRDESKFQSLGPNPMAKSKTILSSSEKYLGTWLPSDPQPRYGRSRTFMEVYRDLSTKIKKY